MGTHTQTHTRARPSAPSIKRQPARASFQPVVFFCHSGAWKRVCTQVVDGLQMFVGQAVRQFELFTGQEAPVKLMEDTLVRELNKK